MSLAMYYCVNKSRLLSNKVNRHFILDILDIPLVYQCDQF